jgi:hypothetical protein
LKQLYNSLETAPEYPEAFRPIPNGIRKLKVKNKWLLEELRKVESGEWSKVYKDGYSGSEEISIHYFESRSGKVFDVKVKRGWSNQ